MESLVRLAKTYVQLCNDGCVLFMDWTVEFLCDTERPVCCVSEFASQGKLKGHRSKHQDLEVSEVILSWLLLLSNVFLDRTHYGNCSFIRKCFGKLLSHTAFLIHINSIWINVVSCV